ncbi:MAG: hypothetical protein WDA16_09670 [Candidatus Thermoplasmatota archaeon]
MSVLLLAGLFVPGSGFSTSWWNAFLLYLTPSALSERLIAGSLGFWDFAASRYQDAPSLLYNPVSFFVGLAAWILVPLAFAIERAAPAAAPPTLPTATTTPPVE